jgi:ureidoacrylate peracid hydrolase
MQGETLRLPLRHFRQYPPENWAGETTELVQVDVASSAFCLVDVYGLGLHPDDAPPHEYPALSSEASLGREVPMLKERIFPALQAARAIGLPVIYVNNSAPRIEFSKGQLGILLQRVTGYRMEDLMSERDADDREYHRSDSRFVEISKLLAPEPGEYFIRKHAYSGFHETRLDSLLRNLNIRSIVFVGFSLDVCLGSTMVDALNRNYEVILLRDCTLASDTPEESEKLAFTTRMITWAEMVVGRTTTSEDFIDECRSLLEARRAGDPLDAEASPPARR